MRQKTGRRGAVLIVVMGVLIVLALLATTFASMQSLERQVARNYLDGVRAKQIARSGVEFAYSRLLEGLNAGQLGNPGFIKSLTYFGNDNAEVGTNPTLVNAPIETATNPSLAVEATGGAFGPLEAPQNPTDINFTPRNIWLRHPTSTTPVSVGFSGLMENSTYGIYSDSFSLNIRDASGMIFVNDGVGESQTLGAVTKNLRRVLNQLGLCPSINIPNLGTTIITNRPTSGYKSKRELLSVLGITNYQKVAPFVTAHAWIDKNVAQPVPLSADPAVLNYYNSWHPGSPPAGSPPVGGHTIYFRGQTPRYRYGYRKDYNNVLLPGGPNGLTFAGAPGLAAPNGLTHAVYGMDELNVRFVELASRAPVNLNSARKEVLMALLSGVHGFFVQERRRDTPPSTMGTTTWNDVAHTYSSAGADEGDQFGFLILSDPVKAPNMPAGPNTSSWIADEIIACRNKVMSPNGLTDYTTAPFGGPFRTWRQFYLFCDNLVDNGAVQDTRVTGANTLYYWHMAPAANKWGTALTNAGVPSINIYRRIGAQAIADAIKANFNPNLHLNEVNPDENMTLMIDKTDLVVASTEGCFMPTGYYEIESLGRVVRPQGSPGNALTSSMAQPCELMAEFKIEAVVKLFDSMRFTSQRDFYGYGTSSPPPPGQNVWPTGQNYWQYASAPLLSLPASNNRLSIEIGPEADWGRAPEQNEWDGYIAWPTNGTELGAPKAPGTPLSGTGDLGGAACSQGISGCVMHGHYTGADFLQHHVNNARNNLNRWSIGLPENCDCWPDFQGAVSDVGPLDPFRGTDPIALYPAYPTNTAAPPWPAPPAGNRYRLARHFRVPNASGTGSMPVFTQEVAPSDHRIDGVYLERHTTLGYWMTNANPSGHQAYNILFSYWMKPRFYPEMSGKTRQYWNWSRLDLRGDYFNLWGGGPSAMAHNPFPLTHYYCSSQNPGVESWASPTWPGFQGQWSPCRPASFIFLSWASWLNVPGSYCPSQCYLGASWGAASPTLNHNNHYGPMGPTTGYAGCSHPMAARRMGASTSGYVPSSQYALRSPLHAGRWIHFMFYFIGSGSGVQKRMYINGESTQHSIAYASNYTDTEWAWPHPCFDWSYHVSGTQSCPPGFYTAPSSQHQCCTNMSNIYDQTARNIIRIGEADRYSSMAASPVGGNPSGANPATKNFVPDVTFDEYYMVNNNSLGAQPDLQAIYNQGRYHIPRMSGEGLFESPNFSLPTGAAGGRALPPPSIVAPPSGVAPAPPPLPPGAIAPPKILGIAWTWAAEWVDTATANLDPVLTDYSTQTSPTPAWLRPRVEASVRIDGTWYGPYTQEYFSAVQLPSTGAPVPVLTPATPLRYRMRFTWGTGTGSTPGPGARVLATPYIDDVTIYYDLGDSGFVDYHMS